MSARRWLVAAILAVCLGASLAQSFDWWDPPGGDDTETNVVVMALCVGLAVSVAAIVVQWFATFVSRPAAQRWLNLARPVSAPALALPGPAASPPSPLRI